MTPTDPTEPPLAHLDADTPLPCVTQAWDDDSPAPGLLAVGGGLAVTRLLEAYTQGIFPWYSQGQPVLWWAPDPRMVLRPQSFTLKDSLRKSIRALLRNSRLEIKVDVDFAGVIQACSDASRHGQRGTWIVPEMVSAYTALHQAGHAHCVTAWVDGQLAGGLYGVGIGQAVFGESMFHRRTDGSKIALAALVALCRAQDVTLVDCQQNTAHLASLGAGEISRAEFCAHLQIACTKPALRWAFEPLYWRLLGADPFANAQAEAV